MAVTIPAIDAAAPTMLVTWVIPPVSLPLTLREESVPSDVIFGCATVTTVPVRAPTNDVAFRAPDKGL